MSKTLPICAKNGVLECSQPVICDHNRSLKKRWYVDVTVSGVRHRVSSGKPFGVPGRGNRADTVKERRQYFSQLCAVLSDLLSAGVDPFADTIPALPSGKAPVTVAECLELAMDEKQKIVGAQTMNVLRFVVRRLCAEFGTRPVSSITKHDIRAFLDKQPGGAGMWNNNRRDVHSLWNTMVDIGVAQINPATAVRKRPAKPTRNEAYTAAEVRLLLDMCASHSRNMRLCARLMFHAFLRPHQEVRLIQRKHVDFAQNRIILPAANRKSSDVFCVPMQDDLRLELKLCGVEALLPDDYLIHCEDPARCVGSQYFRVLWRRWKGELQQAGLLKHGRTLYSIRHTAACMFFDQHRDPYRLQKAMGHASLSSTITYLRSLGRIVSDLQAAEMPRV